MVNIKSKECPKDKLSIKCPYSMAPTRVVIHNTANDASAASEIAYMHSNNKETSFHFAVDDKEIVQGIALNRNAWHAGDGNGKGNREGIGIEICYSKSGGAKFEKAQKNAAELTAYLLKKYGWGIEKVTKHQDYSGKHCPHRTLDQYGWDYFLNLVNGFLKDNETKTTATSKATTTATKTATKSAAKKTVLEIAKEVIAGKWGNGATRKKKIVAAGYNYDKVQAQVSSLLKKQSSSNKYFKACSANSTSIVNALNSVAGKSYSTFSYRKKIASANGIKIYLGTAAQNTKLLKLMKSGKLIKP